MNTLKKSSKLDNVCYDIRGPVLDEAKRMEDSGLEILKLNIGNPAPFGFRAPDEVVAQIAANLTKAEGYIDSKGLVAAREAVIDYSAKKGLGRIDINNVFIVTHASILSV
ncbi:MAG: aminotransferase, partial [Candidatus Kryptoniota bacterium]